MGCTTSNVNLDELKDLSLDNCEDYRPKFEYGKILKVYDGDTVTIGTIMNGKKYKYSVRLNGIDTPELRTRNKIEKKAGYLVRDKLREKIDGMIVRIEILDYDKYGRILGEIYLEDEKITKWLLDNKYCYQYGGGTKETIDWSYLLD